MTYRPHRLTSSELADQAADDRMELADERRQDRLAGEARERGDDEETCAILAEHSTRPSGHALRQITELIAHAQKMESERDESNRMLVDANVRLADWAKHTGCVQEIRDLIEQRDDYIRREQQERILRREVEAQLAEAHTELGEANDRFDRCVVACDSYKDEARKRLLEMAVCVKRCIEGRGSEDDLERMVDKVIEASGENAK